MPPTFSKIFEELFDPKAHLDAGRRERLALWARIFGTIYEDEIRSLQMPWRGLSGNTYRYVGKPGKVFLSGNGVVSGTDFLIERDGNYLVVEGKSQPSAHPDAIEGRAAGVMQWALGASSTDQTFRRLVLGVGAGIPIPEQDDIAKSARQLFSDTKHRAEELVKLVIKARRTPRPEYEVQFGSKREKLSGVGLLLPKPTAGAYDELVGLGVHDVFSIWDLLHERVPSSLKFSWLREFVDDLEQDSTR